MVTLPSSRVSTFTIGVDFGTLSARAVGVDVATGRVIGSRASEYEHGVVDDTLHTTGEPLPPDWALQVPQDYVDSMIAAVRGALADAADAEGVDPHDVVGIGTDFTACTVPPTSAVDRETLDDFATMAGVELACIDASTTIRSFRDELRWNATWYHLARGV